MFYWEIPAHLHEDVEWRFREKVQDIVQSGGYGLEDTSSFVMLAYIDVLRQKVARLEEVIEDLVAREEESLRAIVQDELSRHWRTDHD